MATVNNLKSQLAKTEEKKKPANPMQSMLTSESMKKRFEEVLKDRASTFTSSILTLYNNDKYLSQCQPIEVITEAMKAATLNLPLDKNLGYAYIVAYAARPTFIMGYKGYIQLALRSGQYRFLNAVEIHEGELVSWNPLTEELVIDFEKRKSDAVVGYAGYFELLNGFKKSVYWTKEQIQKHRQRFSKTKNGGVWDSDFDAMALKTVLRNMLGKWGVLSVEMQKAYSDEVASENDEAPTTPIVEEHVEDMSIDADYQEVKTEESQEA